MKPEQIHNAMCHLDAQLIEEAAQPAAKKRFRLRSTLVAACLCLLIAIPVMAATGSLLVRHYSGSNLPENLAGQDLDAYYEAVNTTKLPLSAFSEEAMEAAESQGDEQLHHGFDTWEDMEEFLGFDIYENELLSEAAPWSVELTDADGQVILDVPCSLMLVTDPEEELIGLMANYYCKLRTGEHVSITATAATELNEYDNQGSLGVDYQGGRVIQQHAETYLTASGAECTIISTQNSLTNGWDVDGWILQNGVTLRISRSSQHEEGARMTIEKIMDAFE